MKKYPLEVQPLDDDGWILVSKGHHEIHEFMRAVAEYNAENGGDEPMGVPQHLWFRTLPRPDHPNRVEWVIAKQGERGAWPGTMSEACSADESYGATMTQAERIP